MFSCHKDDEDLPKDYIVIGDYRGMIVDSTHVDLMAAYNSGMILKLDLDKNDSADFRLVVAEMGSPGMGVHAISQLESMNSSCRLYGNFSMDTVYLHQSHHIYSDEYNKYHSITSNYNCRKILPGDVVSGSKTDFHPGGLLKGQKLRMDDTFSADTVSFIYSWSGPVFYNVFNDTVFITYEYYSFDCHELPYGQDIYLGVRCGDVHPKLGWIKLALLSEDRVTLKELAIRKE